MRSRELEGVRTPDSEGRNWSLEQTHMDLKDGCQRLQWVHTRTHACLRQCGAPMGVWRNTRMWQEWL